MSKTKNRLSHSAVSKFQDCAKAYEYHYIKKIRSTTNSAALFFGSAVDHAFSAMLEPKDKTPQQLFDFFWRFQDLNGKQEYLPTSTKIVYANSDYDPELLHQEDVAKLKEEFKLEGDPLKEVEKVYEEKEYMGFDGLPEDRKKLLNFANWLSLYRKGLLMLEALEKQVMPNITEVLGAQVRVDLSNEEGDSIVGFADMVVRWKGYDKPLVLDLKTASRAYDKDAVLVSPQLSLYVHSLSDKYENTRHAGYVVLNKLVNKNKTKKCSKCGKDGTGQRHKTCDADIEGKRCNGEWDVVLKPEIFVQILINEIPPQTEDIVLENFDHINQSIKTGVFPRSFGSCIKPWGKCAYYDLCYKGKMSGLVDMTEEKKEDKQ
jgi:hypothetical protein